MAAAAAVPAKTRLEEVTRLLQDNRRALVAARKRHARAVAAETTISPWRRRVALIIYVLSGHETLAAAVFLAWRRAQRKQGKREAANEVWRGRVEDWFLEASVDYCVGLGLPSDPRQRRALRCARLFQAEHALAQFVAERNEDGTAPSTAALLTKVKGLWALQERHVEHSGDMPRSWLHRQSFAVWASRWRRRWGGRMGALRARDHVPLEVRRSKARVY
jgi:hypothetical protein